MYYFPPAKHPSATMNTYLAVLAAGQRLQWQLYYATLTPPLTHPPTPTPTPPPPPSPPLPFTQLHHATLSYSFTPVLSFSPQDLACQPSSGSGPAYYPLATSATRDGTWYELLADAVGFLEQAGLIEVKWTLEGPTGPVTGPAGKGGLEGNK